MGWRHHRQHVVASQEQDQDLPCSADAGVQTALVHLLVSQSITSSTQPCLPLGWCVFRSQLVPSPTLYLLVRGTLPRSEGRNLRLRRDQRSSTRFISPSGHSLVLLSHAKLYFCPSLITLRPSDRA